MSNIGICSWEQFDYIWDGLYFNLDFRYGALLGTQAHNRSVLGIVAGITKLGERVEWRKYEAQIVIFVYLPPEIDFLRFLGKRKAVEENRKAVEESWKAVEESGKLLKKIRKPLKKAESR